MDQSPDGLLETDEEFQTWLRAFADDWGRFLDTPASAASLETFFGDPTYRIDDYFEDASGWLTYNQFFARHVRPGDRPIDGLGVDTIVVSPADSVYQGQWPISEESEIDVKGLTYSVLDLLEGYPDTIERAMAASIRAGLPWPPAPDRIELGRPVPTHGFSSAFYQQDLSGSLAEELEPDGYWMVPLHIDGEAIALLEVSDSGPARGAGSSWSVNGVRAESELTEAVIGLREHERMVLLRMEFALAVSDDQVRPIEAHTKIHLEEPMTLEAYQDRTYAEYLENVQASPAMAASEAQSMYRPEPPPRWSVPELDWRARRILAVPTLLLLVAVIALPIGLAARGQRASQTARE